MPSKIHPILLLPATVLLASCADAPKKTKSTVPNWIHGQVEQGQVCTQDKGVYSKEKAYEMAIHSCLIQLADKQIQGRSQESRELTVTKQNQYETVKSISQSSNQFEVTAAGKKTMQYDLLGKYYRPQIERAYVWIKLK